jgi:hypothetical protein
MNETRLGTLTTERAQQLAGFLREGSMGSAALAIDQRGMVTGLVDENDADVEHMLGDLDVHA